MPLCGTAGGTILGGMAQDISTRLRLPRSLHARLTRQADRDGCSLHSHMLRLLGEGSARHEREATTMATTTNAPTGDPRDLDAYHWSAASPLRTHDGIDRWAVTSDAGERWVAARTRDPHTGVRVWEWERPRRCREYDYCDD